MLFRLFILNFAYLFSICLSSDCRSSSFAELDQVYFLTSAGIIINKPNGESSLTPGYISKSTIHISTKGNLYFESDVDYSFIKYSNLKINYLRYKPIGVGDPSGIGGATPAITLSKIDRTEISMNQKFGVRIFNNFNKLEDGRVVNQVIDLGAILYSKFSGFETPQVVQMIKDTNAVEDGKGLGGLTGAYYWLSSNIRDYGVGIELSYKYFKEGRYFISSLIRMCGSSIIKHRINTKTKSYDIPEEDSNISIDFECPLSLNISNSILFQINSGIHFRDIKIKANNKTIGSGVIVDTSNTFYITLGLSFVN